MRRVHEDVPYMLPDEWSASSDDELDRPSGELRLDRSGARARRQGSIDVGEVMSGSLFAIGPETSVTDARRIAHACFVHHLLVTGSLTLRDAHEGARMASYDLHRQQLAGIVCHHDLEGAHPSMPVADRMSRPVVSVGIAAALEHAAYVMSRAGVGALPVLDEGRVAGIVTRTDLRRGGVPDELLEPPRCVSCDGRRKPHLDYRGYGVTLCADCAERAIEPIPYRETGTGD